MVFLIRPLIEMANIILLGVLCCKQEKEDKHGNTK
jgi:hypothetical protein